LSDYTAMSATGAGLDTYQFILPQVTK